jgi:Winged helix-turn-helix domain (DUF2582)
MAMLFSARKGVVLMVTGTHTSDVKGTELVPDELAQEELAQIGAVAGIVWRYLDEHGPATLSKLVKGVEVPRDMVMQGIGWLAREDKIRFEDGARSKLISLA